MPLKSLSEYVKNHKGDISLIDLISMGKLAAAGMEYLEKNDMVHRDLALRNLLVSKSGDKFVVKISG